MVVKGWAVLAAAVLTKKMDCRMQIASLVEDDELESFVVL